MATTLSNGYKKPVKGDTQFWTDLEGNIQRLNDHDHDGTDGNKIQAKNITKSTTTISSDDWATDSGGSTFSASITMPTGHTFDNCVMMFLDTDNGDVIYPTVEKTGESAYTVTVNDDTLNLKVIYA